MTRTAVAKDNQVIRVVIQQPALPKYRVPVFAGLARREGIGVHLLYAENAGLPNVSAAGFEAQYVPMRVVRVGRHPVMWHRAQWGYASRRRADVLILSWDLHYVSLIPALLRARLNGVPTILWGHGYSKQEAGWRSWLRDRVARLGTALLLYNHTTAQAYVQRGWDPERVYVALNCLDQGPIQAARQKWLSSPERLEAFRQEHGLSPGPNVLFVSRLEPANRVDLLIQAAAEVVKELPDLNVLIVGKGEDMDRLRDLAAGLGLAQRVRFLGAIYEEEQLAPWFLCSQVFCYPANIGLSLLHAFGYGLPVVTSDRIEAQNPEIEALRDGQNGLLYRDGDAGSLAGGLQRILSDQDLGRRLSEAALATATEQFTLSNMIDGFEAAIRYCVRSK